MSSPSSSGVRSLQKARLHGSTSRIIDIPRLQERYNNSNKNSSNPDDSSIFATKQLNNAIIIKHILRNHEKELFDTNKFSATKLIFPFSKSDLQYGGLSIFIDEKGYSDKLLRFIGLESPDEKFTRDERILRILEDLPSFDPFLISERAAMEDVILPAGLIDLSDRDLVNLREVVSSALSKITAMALPEGAVSASDRLAVAFLANRDDDKLAPLREAFKMSAGDFRAAVFGWKGILYYQWKLQDSSRTFSSLIKTLSEMKPIDGNYETRKIIVKRSRHVVSTLNVSMVKLAEVMINYEEAVRKLKEEKNPSHMSNFLKNSHETFKTAGDNASIISHCIDYWHFGMQKINWSKANTELVIDLLNGLSAPLPGHEHSE